MRPQRVGVTTAAMHYSFTRRSAPPYCSAGAAGWPMPHVATHDRARTPGGDPGPGPPDQHPGPPDPRHGPPWEPRNARVATQPAPVGTGQNGPSWAPKKDARNMVPLC